LRSLLLFLDSKFPLQAELLASKRALRLMLAPQGPLGRSACHVSVLDRTAIAHRVSSAGEHGQAVSPGAAYGRANVSADAVSSWLFVIGLGGRGCGTGTAVGDGCGWTVRVRMDIVAK